MEMLIVDQQKYNLTTFEFDGKISPKGYEHLVGFRQDIGVHFDYELHGVKLTKSVYLLRNVDAAIVIYDFKTVKKPLEFTVRPFIGLRDFHSLQKSYACLQMQTIDSGVFVQHNIPGSCELLLKADDCDIEEDKQWWFNFVYRIDKQRGQDFIEDLWSPGFYKWRINNPEKIVLRASLHNNGQGSFESHVFNTNVRQMIKDLHRHQQHILSQAKTRDRVLNMLYLGADQFINRRQSGSADVNSSASLSDKRYLDQKFTILAGFPWFADWGRDAFISLPGLLLSTERFLEAKSVLTTFAGAADDGMIPNRFDDRSDTAYFNSIDSSLWFINAAFAYLSATDDNRTFTSDLLPVIRWIVDSYQKGTRFNIRADQDGLITGGDANTQLTWMDAKYQNIAFTPRFGKAVEVNALWYNSLCLLAQFYLDRDVETANHFHSLADTVEKSFRDLFFNTEKNYLNDCIHPDGKVDSSLRPNQIFAVSLGFSPINAEQQTAVIQAVEKHLLTPYGLRSLSPFDEKYIGTYIGPQSERDKAYHQGTVWGYLLGPYVEAYLKVNDYSKKSKKQALTLIEPLVTHLTSQACLGQISEIFDGDKPHTPRGCFAQAWSVAELLRIYKLING